MPMEVSDDAIIYQLHKVDQGGDVMDLIEPHMEWLAEEWGYELNPDCGCIVLPDGRHANIALDANIDEPCRQGVTAKQLYSMWAQEEGLRLAEWEEIPNSEQAAWEQLAKITAIAV